MKISEEFPSKWLKASDLNDNEGQPREARVTMGNVEKEKLGDDMKLVLYFKGKEKGLVLNKTNSNAIVDAYGDDTDDWFGQEIILFSVMADFQGKVGPAIRVRAPTARDRKKADPISSGPQSDQQSQGRAPLDDNIPFAPELR